MENLFMQIAQQSPVLGLMLVFWFYNRRDYKDYVDKVQAENAKREETLRQTISKNQEIIYKNQEVIIELTEKFNVVEDVKKDVEEIKVILNR